MEKLAEYIASLEDEEFKRAVGFPSAGVWCFSAREKRTITENLGELWGLNKDVAADVLEAPLTEAEEKKLESLEEFGLMTYEHTNRLLFSRASRTLAAHSCKESQESLEGMGGSSCSLSPDQQEMDEALEAIYAPDDQDPEMNKDDWTDKKIGGKGDHKGRVMPKVAKWLDQVRNFFPKDVVVLLQHDAIERRGMKELLFEPEIMAKVEPSIDLASTVLQLKNMVPEKAKSAARESRPPSRRRVAQKA